MRVVLGLCALLLGCAAKTREDAPTSSREARLGLDLLLNGDAENGLDGRCAPWDFTPHAWTQGVTPSLSKRPAPSDGVPGGFLGIQKREGGHALEVDLPGSWNAVRVLQEVKEVSTPASYRCEGFIRVSEDFEGSVQAILSSKAGLAVYGFARRAWFNVPHAGSIFLPYHKKWSRFAVDLPCSEETSSTLVFLLEGKGRVWFDDLQLREIMPSPSGLKHR